MDRLHELHTKTASESVEQRESKSRRSGTFNERSSNNASETNFITKAVERKPQEQSAKSIEQDDDGGGDGNDQAQIILVQQTMEEAENKLKELSAALAKPVIVENVTNFNTIRTNNLTMCGISEMQDTFANTQTLLDKCATLLQRFDNKERKTNSLEPLTVTSMRERVSAHLHRKLNTLRQQLWIAEDEWHRRRVENVARQLWLRFGHTSEGEANANRYLNSITNNAQEDDQLIEPVYSIPHDADRFNEEDVNLLAEALVYAERDNAVFGMSTYEIREAVERYNTVCNIEDKMRRLHHLFSELNWQVHAQDDDLHNLAQNVDATHVKVLNAREQLQRAKKYHSRCGCGCCCCMM